MQVKREKNHNILQSPRSGRPDSIRRLPPARKNSPLIRAGNFKSQWELLLDRSILLSGSQQSADRQGDLLLLLINSGDLGIDDLALGENVFGLLNAAVSDLGDVDQAVYAGNHLSESAEGHQLDDANLGGIAHTLLVH